MGEFRGRVVDAGGGQVRILVDRDTEEYPSVGQPVVGYYHGADWFSAASEHSRALIAEVERLRERIEFLETVLKKDGWDGPMMFGKWPVTAGEATTALSEDE